MNKALIALALLLSAQTAHPDINSIRSIPGGASGSVQLSSNGLFAGTTDFTYSTSLRRLSLTSLRVGTLFFPDGSAMTSGGSSVYPASATASFPYGLTASSGTFTSTMTIGQPTADGSGTSALVFSGLLMQDQYTSPNQSVYYGNRYRTHILLGGLSQTGAVGQNYEYCAVLGGLDNKATNHYAVVAGGSNNTASGYSSGIFACDTCSVSNYASAIVGGSKNSIAGQFSGILGGQGMYLTGQRSWAFGYSAFNSPVTISDSDVFIVYSAKVGIGLVSPQYALDVSGSIRASTGFIGDGSALTNLSTSTLADVSQVNSTQTYLITQIAAATAPLATPGMVNSTNTALMTSISTTGADLSALRSAVATSTQSLFNAISATATNVNSLQTAVANSTATNFQASQATGAALSAFQAAVIASTNTLGLTASNTNYIYIGSTLQPGATFFVSSGTVTNLNASTITASAVFIGTNASSGYSLNVASLPVAFNSSRAISINSWIINANSLLGPRQFFTGTGVNGYLYTTGGYFNAALSSCTVAQVNSDGSVGPFANINSLPDARYNSVTATYSGFLYSIAGNDAGGVVSSSVTYARLNKDGSVGTWKRATNLLPNGRQYPAVWFANGYMYVAGGFGNDGGSGAKTTVYRAKLMANGDIGAWTTEGALASATREPVGNAPVANGYAYVISGNGGTTVQYAKIKGDGSMGTWNTTTALPEKHDTGGAFAVNGYIVVASGGSSPHVYHAQIKADGSLGSWVQDPDFLMSFQDGAWAMVNGYIYSMGGTSVIAVSSVTYGSLPRMVLGGNLDMVGFSAPRGSSLTFDTGGQFSQITAGSMQLVDRLEVDGNTQMFNGLGVAGTLAVVGSSATIASSPLVFLSAADNSTVLSVQIDTAQAGITASDTFIDFRSSTQSEAAIQGTSTPGLIAYNTFTGSHYTIVGGPIAPLPMMLLEATGQKIDRWSPAVTTHTVTVQSTVFNQDGSTSTVETVVTTTETVQGAAPKGQIVRSRVCSTRQSPAAWGFYGGQDQYGRDMVLAIGTGYAVVVNTGIDIAVGDYLISSSTPGAVERQSDDILHNYSVAKSLENIVWRVGETRRKIAVTYHGG